jgi:hypothetical protein
VQSDRESAGGRSVQGHPARLRGAHDRAEVVLREDPLDRYGRRRELLEQRGDTRADREQPLLELEVGRSADDPDVHECRRAVGRDIHDPHTAPGEARVDAEHANGHPAMLARTTGPAAEARVSRPNRPD